MRNLARAVRRRGFTLSELLVHSILFGLLMTGLQAAFLTGSRHLSQTASASETLQESLVPVRLLAQEMGESADGAIRLFDGADRSAVGVVFVSPRDTGGNFQTDPSTGRPRWMKHVGYWLESDPQDSSKLALVRAETPLRAPQTVPPAPSMTTDDFKNESFSRRVLAQGLQPGDLQISRVMDPGHAAKIRITLSARRTARGTPTEMSTSLMVTPRNR